MKKPKAKQSTPKFKVYVLDFGCSTDIFSEDILDILEWIKNDAEDLKSTLDELEYKITFKMLTRRQINALPEWS